MVSSSLLCHPREILRARSHVHATCLRFHVSILTGAFLLRPRVLIHCVIHSMQRYISYDAMQAPGHPDHIIAIDRLSPDLLSSSKELMAIMPDSFIEGTMLFKRKDRYYVIYGSCCCACRQGSGAVVVSATNLKGPWVKQQRDVNCQANVSICAGMAAEPALHRHTGDLTIAAQGIGISTIKGADETIYIWNGMRWLSGPHNPPACNTLCSPATGVCAQDPSYRTASDYDYWIPLQFDAEGAVQQFEDFVDEYTLTLE